MSIVGLGRPDVSIRLKGEARIRTFPGLEEKRGGPRSAPTQTATRHAKEQKLKGYSWEPESPLLPSPLEEPGLPPPPAEATPAPQAEKRSEEHTSELQSLTNLVCRLLLEKKKKQ